MTEAFSFTKNSSSLKKTNSSYENENKMKKRERKNSINSSSSECSFNNLNSEIKSIIENETDLSFSSNSNSDIEENKANIEHLFDSKYWRVSKEINSETDEPNSTFESQNEKETPTKKIRDKFIFIDGKISPKLFNPKYMEIQEMAGISVGSNKKSTQSNEDEEPRLDHLNNISYCESNNSPSHINSLENNENEENENEKVKTQINNEKVKVSENNKEKIKKNNINNINDNKLFNNGFNNYNNIHLKYNNDSEYISKYEPINYKNNAVPFFQNVYLPQQLCSFMSNYNYANLNKKNFIQNNNNKLEEISSSKKNEDFHSPLDSSINGQNNQYIHSYMNNANNYKKKIDLVDLPLVMNQSIPHNNTINYRYPKIGNYNILCCPQIQPGNVPIQKAVVEKTNNSSNYLPEINNKENSTNLNEQNAKNSNNALNNSNLESNSNICPIIEQNNKIKINNKNFIINKNTNVFNNKGNLKGEKQVLNLDDIVTGKDLRTTVMIRNIPIKYTDEILKEALNEFNGKYDCLYMPYDYEKNGNKGYAFINFVNPLHILYFYEKFNGKKWIHFESSKICELNCAHFQGINEIQKHAKNYKGQKKPSYYSRNENNENMFIPSKYLLKLKKRFPKMQYSENKIKKLIVVKSFE